MISYKHAYIAFMFNMMIHGLSIILEYHCYTQECQSVLQNTDDGWYLDSGATHQLTNNIANLNIRDEFRDNDKLIIGNGEGLSITHNGDISLIFKGSKAYHACLCIALKDILVVPSIIKNLLSISKLTGDNNISVEFFGSIQVVKVLQMGQVLLQGNVEKGLYKLLFKHISSSVFNKSQSQLTTPLSMLSFCHLPFQISFVARNNYLKLVINLMHQCTLLL